jgi:hypothetical protein
VLYVGTAPEQKTESAKSGLNTTFKPLFYKCILILFWQEQALALRHYFMII